MAEKMTILETYLWEKHSIWYENWRKKHSVTTNDYLEPETWLIHHPPPRGDLKKYSFLRANGETLAAQAEAQLTTQSINGTTVCRTTRCRTQLKLTCITTVYTIVNRRNNVFAISLMNSSATHFHRKSLSRIRDHLSPSSCLAAFRYLNNPNICLCRLVQQRTRERKERHRFGTRESLIMLYKQPRSLHGNASTT